MIPLNLRLSGFLSYQDSVDLNFSGFELACISGQNGAGKSSLLDALTWVLFGEARCRDEEALINSRVNAAEVVFDFSYETNTYRVQRSKRRGKTTLLEFYILSPQGSWRPLTEKSIRETEARLRSILRLDYDTFVNASFFLQGRADLFAQQNPGNRKKVLSSVLGLEVWEVYRAQTGERRKGVESELRGIDVQLEEIDTELAEEGARKIRLAEIEQRLKLLSDQRKARESGLDVMRRLAASLAEQKRLLDVLGGRLAETRGRLRRMESQLNGLEVERNLFEARVSAAADVEASYQAWQAARAELERWDAMAASFHEVQARRAGPLTEIAAARSQLEEERRGLILKANASEQDRRGLSVLENELPLVLAALGTAREQLGRRGALEEEIRVAQQQVADADAENRRLRAEMANMKERIDRLKQAEGVDCPLCGQPLNPDDRAALIAGLEADGKLMGDTFRANQRTVEQSAGKLRDLNLALVGITRYEEEAREQVRRQDQLEAEAGRLRQAILLWSEEGQPRLNEVDRRLAEEDFGASARARLAEIDAQARDLGYDPAAHDAVRHAEQRGRAAEQALRELDVARASLEPLVKQISSLENQAAIEREALEKQESEYNLADGKYLSDSASLPDLDQAEREMLTLQAEENRLRTEVGMVRQMVNVLENQRERKARLSVKRLELARELARFKVLERAFGKDGVPALLIEQALPEIESQANEILDRLSAGGMSVRFSTQRQLKSKDEKRETLDIIISDAAGERAYEMFSGGEAFRVNFAIRLALSRVLSHRAGARLQTLFIDEGFGSQDADGRQRLLEAINLVRSEFARILVITHLEELKEAFPARIEVEKTPHGSQVRMMI